MKTIDGNHPWTHGLPERGIDYGMVRIIVELDVVILFVEGVDERHGGVSFSFPPCSASPRLLLGRGHTMESPAGLYEGPHAH